MMGGTERRASRRVSFGGVTYVASGGRDLPAVAIDLSPMGMGLVVPGQVLPGAYLRLRFHLGDGRDPRGWCEADGTVVRVESRGSDSHVGVAFTVIESRVVQRLHEYLRSRQTEKTPVVTETDGRRRTPPYVPAIDPPPPPGFPGGPTAAPHQTGEFGLDEVTSLGKTGTHEARREPARGVSGRPLPTREMDPELLGYCLNAVHRLRDEAPGEE